MEIWSEKSQKVIKSRSKITKKEKKVSKIYVQTFEILVTAFSTNTYDDKIIVIIALVSLIVGCFVLTIADCSCGCYK